ncbi:pleiotropic drug resistance protein 1-like, partial [Macadamia integrifolia]|uniref:pleiotropic drug resistance protein 1-like n=1 Tax=Macadamia integrifolia TaxID=60698 RepID=UPI001C4F6233
AAALDGQEISVVTDYVLKILGLEACADTLVGDQMLRGISGGQRKRVTTGEMLVGPASALFMDEISTGLDTSTTFQIVNSIRQSNHILNGTAVVSLLQPAPEVDDLFDDIILLSDGQIIYQGPREHVLEFFEYMGFKCPERMGVADFLQEVTSRKDQQQYWTHENKPYRFIPAKEFSEVFHSFHVGQKLADELAAPFDKNNSHPAALVTKKYSVSKKELLKACISREILLMKSNSFVYIFKMVQITVVAFITMTIFLRTEMKCDSVTDGGIFLGALFYALNFLMFNGLPELAMTVMKLPVFYKQRDFFFYPAWAYLLPTWMMASGLFRFIGTVGRNMIVANTFGSFAFLILMGLGGFILSRAMVQSNSTESLEVAVLNSRAFFTEACWYWIGVGALIGYVFLFNGLSILAVSYLNPFGKPHAVLSEEKSSVESGEKTKITISSRTSSARIAASDANMSMKQGMVLPFEPLSLTFDEIRYSIDMPQEIKARGVTEVRLELLKGVSGAFRPRVLTALMGVSGAGKTTLMDVLSGRKTGVYIKGNIKISGYPKKQETFACVSGCCEQNDIHSPHVMIYESLFYSAWLRLPLEVNSSTRKMFIEEVMELVELTTLRHAIVGLPCVNGL